VLRSSRDRSRSRRLPSLPASILVTAITGVGIGDLHVGRRGGRDAAKRSNGRTQPARGRGGRPGKPKVCQFCATRAVWVDYKDVTTLRRLMSDRGKIKARRVTGTCRQHQRDVAVAIKTARELALLPYALSPNTEKSGPRGRPREVGLAVNEPQEPMAEGPGTSPEPEPGGDEEGTEELAADAEPSPTPEAPDAVATAATTT
jgi:small subunit ribosomal protein S18